MKNKKKILIIIAAVAVVALISSFVIPWTSGGYKKKTTVVSKASLEKILKISELSTNKAVYNGVAHVYAPGDSTRILYHISYEANVKAGINADDIQTDVDKKEKKITVTLPKVKINDIEVKIESLDYMFEDKSSNTEDVIKDAYKKAVEDVTKKSSENTQIKELAKQNAENVIKGLINPLLEQQKDSYTLEINWQEN